MSDAEDFISEAEQAMRASRATADRDYPRFHLASPLGRINDPNGLVVVDGTYHAFYQFGPFFPERKLVYWGHATSSDLLNWHHQAPALAPDRWYDRSGVYSGGALVHDGTVWLHYTGNVKNPDGTRESYQCLATTTDLAQFAKYDANPLINGQPAGYTAHFRDPQVWADADGSYRMCLGGQREDESGCALLYRSTDLIAWSFEGELTFPGSAGRFDDFGYMWECPNLLRLTDEATGTEHDVLVFCPQGLGFDDDLGHNQFPCGYVVGRLEGTQFHDASEFIELDRGFEFYAPQAFSRAPGEDGPCVLVGWLGNPGEDDQPSLEAHGWVHTLSLARTLTLRDGRLFQTPALGDAAPRPLALTGTSLTDATQTIDALAGVDSFALRLTLELAESASCTVQIGTRDDSYVAASVDRDKLVIDRGATRYPHGGRRTVVRHAGQRVDLDLVHDRSVTEWFIDGGASSLSMRSYLTEGDIQVSLHAQGTVKVVRAALVPMP